MFLQQSESGFFFFFFLTTCLVVSQCPCVSVQTKTRGRVCVCEVFEEVLIRLIPDILVGIVTFWMVSRGAVGVCLCVTDS